MEDDVSPGDLLVDLLRHAEVVSRSFDPFDADFSEEAATYEALAAKFVNGFRTSAVQYHVNSTSKSALFGLRRPGFPPERIDSIAAVAKVATAAGANWKSSPVVWYTSECSVNRHVDGAMFDTPVVFTTDGAFFEDPDDPEALISQSWTTLPSHQLEEGPYSPRLILMDGDYESAYTILPYERSLAWPSFNMADAVLAKLLFTVRQRLLSAEDVDDVSPQEWTQQSVTHVLSQGELVDDEAIPDAYEWASGDMIVDFLQIAGVWPADVEPDELARSGQLPQSVIQACDRLFESLESNPESWYEIGVELNERCWIVTDHEHGDVMHLGQLDELPGVEHYPWDWRAPLWYTSGITINSMYTGPMVFLRDGWVGVDPEDQTTYRFNSWGSVLEHRWPDRNGEGEFSESLMRLGDLELDFDTAGCPPWKRLNLKLADVILRRVLPVAQQSKAGMDLKHPPIAEWTADRIHEFMLGTT